MKRSRVCLRSGHRVTFSRIACKQLPMLGAVLETTETKTQARVSR